MTHPSLASRLAQLFRIYNAFVLQTNGVNERQPSDDYWYCLACIIGLCSQMTDSFSQQTNSWTLRFRSTGGRHSPTCLLYGNIKPCINSVVSGNSWNIITAARSISRKWKCSRLHLLTKRVLRVCRQFQMTYSTRFETPPTAAGTSRMCYLSDDGTDDSRCAA